MVDKDRIKGSANQAAGKVKEWAGKATGDSKTEAEGKADQVKGKVQNAVGGLKDAVARQVIAMRTASNSSPRVAAMHSEAYHRFLTASGYMIISAIVVLSMAYLPTLAGTLLTTLDILPTHLM